MIRILSDEWRDCKERLRKIVIHSADVLPREVSVYLNEAAKYGSWDAKRAILTEYRPLVDYLPKEYVDFTLNVLITKPRLRHHPYDDREDLLGQLGIEDYREFFPPAHIQGPFLYLLRSMRMKGSASSTPL